MEVLRLLVSLLWVLQQLLVLLLLKLLVLLLLPLILVLVTPVLLSLFASKWQFEWRPILLSNCFVVVATAVVVAATVLPFASVV